MVFFNGALYMAYIGDGACNRDNRVLAVENWEHLDLKSPLYGKATNTTCLFFNSSRVITARQYIFHCSSDNDGNSPPAVR